MRQISVTIETEHTVRTKSSKSISLPLSSKPTREAARESPVVTEGDITGPLVEKEA